MEHLPAVTYIDAIDDAASSSYISGQVERLLGYTAAEWRNDPDLWMKLLHPEDREAAIEENRRTNEAAAASSMEYRLIARDGRVVWIHDQFVYIRDDEGNPMYNQGVMLDITERREAEGAMRQAEGPIPRDRGGEPGPDPDR